MSSLDAQLFVMSNNNYISLNQRSERRFNTYRTDSKPDFYGHMTNYDIVLRNRINEEMLEGKISVDLIKSVHSYLEEMHDISYKNIFFIRDLTRFVRKMNNENISLYKNQLELVFDYQQTAIDGITNLEYCAFDDVLENLIKLKGYFHCQSGKFALKIGKQKYPDKKTSQHWFTKATHNFESAINFSKKSDFMIKNYILIGETNELLHIYTRASIYKIKSKKTYRTVIDLMKENNYEEQNIEKIKKKIKNVRKSI